MEVVDKTGNDRAVDDERALAHRRHVGLQRSGLVGDGEWLEADGVTAGDLDDCLDQLGIGGGGHLAVCVLHDGYARDTKGRDRQSQGAEDVSRYTRASVAQDLRIARLESEDSEGIDARVDAGDDGEAATGHARVGDLVLHGGVALVGLEQVGEGVLHTLNRSRREGLAPNPCQHHPP